MGRRPPISSVSRDVRSAAAAVWPVRNSPSDTFTTSPRIDPHGDRSVARVVHQLQVESPVQLAAPLPESPGSTQHRHRPGDRAPLRSHPARRPGARSPVALHPRRHHLLLRPGDRAHQRYRVGTRLDRRLPPPQPRLGVGERPSGRRRPRTPRLVNSSAEDLRNGAVAVSRGEHRADPRADRLQHRCLQAGRPPSGGRRGSAPWARSTAPRTGSRSARPAGRPPPAAGSSRTGHGRAARRAAPCAEGRVPASGASPAPR
jgi:hypothetical protein